MSAPSQRSLRTILIAPFPAPAIAAWPRPSRPIVLAWLGVMLTGLVLIVINYPKYQVGAYFDDSFYITLARSLVSGGRYGLINFPGEPLPGNFPVGLPLLLAPLVGLFPDNLPALKLLAAAATLANASLVFWGWRLLSRSLSYWWGLAISALFLLAVVTIDLSGMVMSEPAFLTFTLLAILLAERLVSGRRLPGWPVWMGVCLFFILFIRTIGVTFFAALLLYLLLAGGRAALKPLLLALGVLALVVSLLLALTPIGFGDLFPVRYLGSLPPALSGALEPPSEAVQAQPLDGQAPESSLLHDYLIGGGQDLLRNKLREALLPVSLSGRGQAWAEAVGLAFLPAMLGYAVSLVILLGAYAWLRRERLTAFNLAGIAYLAGLFLWVWQEPRFLYPILPQLLLALLLGMKAIIDLAARLAGRLAQKDLTRPAGVLLAALVASFAVISALRSATISPSHLHLGQLAGRTAWLEGLARPGEHLASEYPTVDYLYSGLATVEYPYPADKGALLAFLKSSDVEYLLVAPAIRWMTPRYSPDLNEEMAQIAGLLAELDQAGYIQLVFSSPQELVQGYRVLR